MKRGKRKFKQTKKKMSLKRYARQGYLKKKLSLVISTNSTKLEKPARIIRRTLWSNLNRTLLEKKFTLKEKHLNKDMSKPNHHWQNTGSNYWKMQQPWDHLSLCICRCTREFENSFEKCKEWMWSGKIC